jgi:hypothetical protein
MNTQKRKLYLQQYKIKNKDSITEYHKNYRLKNKKKIQNYLKNRYLENKSVLNAKNKENYQKTKDKRKQYALNYYKHNKEEQSLRCKEWYNKNREQLLLKTRKRFLARDKKLYNKKMQEKMSCNPTYRVRKTLATRVLNALKRSKATKSAKLKTLLGCTFDEARAHIQKQFKSGMSWKNHGEWHIDHIKPLSKFNLLDPQEQLKAFNYKNLQPLWAKENLSKGSKYLVTG